MTRMKIITLALATLIAVTAFAGCMGGGNNQKSASALQQAGSSTVYPIAEAWAAELAPRGLQVVVGGGGSGAGASKLCAGEIDIGDMSRSFKKSEVDACQAKGIDPLTWKVAYDGLTIVVNKENAFVDHLTVEELRHVWRSENPAQTWADVRQGWPAEKIVLFGPDSDSGTYEYFNEEILGKTCGPTGDKMCAPRSDYTPSPEDNVLVEGVASSKNAIGHFGFAYYLENKDRLKSVPVQAEGETTPVAPTFETIASGAYKPLSRPLYMVTDGKPAPGTPLHTYFTYAMGEGQSLVREVGYVELDEQTLSQQRAWL